MIRQPDDSGAQAPNLRHQVDQLFDSLTAQQIRDTIVVHRAYQGHQGTDQRHVFERFMLDRTTIVQRRFPRLDDWLGNQDPEIWLWFDQQFDRWLQDLPNDLTSVLPENYEQAWQREMALVFGSR